MQFAMLLRKYEKRPKRCAEMTVLLTIRAKINIEKTSSSSSGLRGDTKQRKRESESTADRWKDSCKLFRVISHLSKAWYIYDVISASHHSDLMILFNLLFLYFSVLFLLHRHLSLECYNGECTSTGQCECAPCWQGPSCNEPGIIYYCKVMAECSEEGNIPYWICLCNYLQCISTFVKKIN